MHNESTALRVHTLGCLLALPVMLALAGCQGISSASKQSTGNPTSGQLSVTPTTMSFGNVAVGGNSQKQGSLTAGSADIQISTAAWNGQGYSLSGITFPATVPAGKSIPFTITFAPQAAGSAPGSLVFDSNATNAPTTEVLTGSGTQLSSHTVALSWNPSTSQVIGYNVYRRIGSSGSYTKINPSVNPTTSFTDNAVQSGVTYDYVTTAIDSSNVESAYSNQATAAIP